VDLRLDLAIILRTITALLRRNETYPGGIDEVDLASVGTDRAGVRSVASAEGTPRVRGTFTVRMGAVCRMLQRSAVAVSCRPAQHSRCRARHRIARTHRFPGS